MLCPKCKTDNAHRSRRASTGERLTSIVGYFPYRCRQCSHRFQTFTAEPSAPRVPPTAAEKEVARTHGASRWKRRRLEMWMYTLALTLFGVVLYLLTRAPSPGD
jgi:hypothetical protein